MKKCPNCKGKNVTELVWGYPSREFLEKSFNENDDLFVKIAAMIGGDDYLKIARSLKKIQHRTEEEISKSTGLSIFRVRRALFDMFGRSFQFDEQSGCFGTNETDFSFTKSVKFTDDKFNIEVSSVIVPLSEITPDSTTKIRSAIAMLVDRCVIIRPVRSTRNSLSAV